MAKEKQRIIDREVYQLERIEARKQALADRPNPYQKEIDTCERLVGYCDALKFKHGLTKGPADEVVKEE